MTRLTYITAKNPKNNLWYVLGFCGKKYYIPVSNGYKNRKDAKHFAKLQPTIDYNSRIAGANSI